MQEFKPGDTVRIKSGPFKSFISVVTKVVLVHSQCSQCLRGDKSAKTSSLRRHGEHEEPSGT